MGQVQGRVGARTERGYRMGQFRFFIHEKGAVGFEIQVYFRYLMLELLLIKW